MPSFKLEELSYPALDSFDRGKTLFIIAVSPLEEHGPHLPLGVDAFNAEYFAEEISRMFLQKYPEWNVVRIPALYLGSFLFQAPGSIPIKPRTVRNLLVNIFASLAEYGFRYFLISNAHGGPTHVVALEEAARVVSGRYNARAISFSGHLIWNFLRGNYWSEMKERLRLNEEDWKALKEDAHAGQWETSMMLKLRPDLVDAGYKSLPPFRVNWTERVRRNYPLKLGHKLGYVGHPSRAGERLAEVSSQFLLEKAFAFVESNLFSEQRSPASIFYRIGVFRTNFLAVSFLLVLIVLFAWLIVWFQG